MSDLMSKHIRLLRPIIAVTQPSFGTWSWGCKVEGTQASKLLLKLYRSVEYGHVMQKC
jgi:hypothetical protein